jgi:hypothetical protein
LAAKLFTLMDCIVEKPEIMTKISSAFAFFSLEFHSVFFWLGGGGVNNLAIFLQIPEDGLWIFCFVF